MFNIEQMSPPADSMLTQEHYVAQTNACTYTHTHTQTHERNKKSSKNVKDGCRNQFCQMTMLHFTFVRYKIGAAKKKKENKKRRQKCCFILICIDSGACKSDAFH